ncbi:MAG: hypothetical protein H0T76_19875 [Nannocystis sp.]|nr:hypothetical protein [Nannocystis sp.]MBA3548747.1 hypothetical protein [Nannocystis sp.]
MRRTSLVRTSLVRTALARSLAAALSTLSLGACVFGYRGEVVVTATYPATDLKAVSVDLGASPLTIVGDALAPGIELSGAWHSIGGNAAGARELAATPTLQWTVEGTFAELLAVVPLAAEGQVDFELDELRVPPDLDIELRTTLGDVDVFAVEGNISADVDVGHVRIEGGAGGIAVRTGEGNLEIVSTGNVDASTGLGGAKIWQDGAGGNDLVVQVVRGDIEIRLRSDANLDLQLVGAEIRVQTGSVSTITRGEFSRQVGAGSVKVWAEALGGDIHVSLVEEP